MTFAHLHTHSHFSLLDGLAIPEDYITCAAELEQPAVALTDHGSLSGAYALWKAAKGTGVQPIIGSELYFAPEGRTHKKPVLYGTPEQKRMDVGDGGKRTHLTVLARNATGLRNLYRIQAEAYRTGFYGKPRTDLELLSEYSEGLTCLTGCAGGLTSIFLRLERYKDARQHLSNLRDVFGDNLFVEVMWHAIDEPDLNELEVNGQLVRLAEELRLPLVLTNDAHFCDAEDVEVHDALLCVQTHAKVSDEKRFRFNGDQSFYLASAEEMKRKCEAANIPLEATQRTLEIAESVDSYDEIFRHQLRMPKWHGHGRGVSAELEMDEQVKSWLGNNNLSQQYLERASYELDTITSLGFADYFLVVADILNEAKVRDIRIGPARGSVGGSLVAYVLGIQSVDPIPSGLLFERFLNPERVGLPDIDIDIQEDRRDEVLAIAREKYGDENVASLGTFGTIAAKAALKDSARVLGYPYKEGEQRTWQLPPVKQGFNPTLADYKGERDDPVYELATGLEGTIRSESVHAAAVIISPEPLHDLIPLRRQGGKGHDVAALDMHEIEDLGFVKTDLLGLRTLKVIDDCLHMLMDNPMRGTSSGVSEARSHEDVPLPTDPRECTDPATYELLAAGDTTGVFQLDGSGMRGLLRQVVPDRFEDISAVLALYRPGPMGAKADRDYAQRKQGKQRVSYPHPELEEALAPILSETYGLIVYQEQVLEALAAVGDYGYGSAELIFNAMRKKLPEKMAEAKPDFTRRMKQKGYSHDAIEALWDVLIPFSAYSFNKSHSTGYALIAYWTAYLKANYPREWMASLLSNETDNDKLYEYLAETRRIGIPLLPPDVNSSGATFTPTEEGIRYGLAAIKGVGEKALDAIVGRRPYRSWSDYIGRVPAAGLDSGTVGALVRAGAFDELTPHRESLERTFSGHVDRARAARKAKRGGQRGIVKPTYAVAELPADMPQRRTWERETLGVELSSGKVYILPLSPLTSPEMEWIRQALDHAPGHQPVFLDLGITEVDLGCFTRISDAQAVLQPLGKLEIQER